MGRIASYYYIKHETMLHFKKTLKSNLTIEDLLEVLSNITEYAEVPVRHNEEHLNALVKSTSWYVFSNLIND